MIKHLTRQEANNILDGARAGLAVHPETIDAALLATGDLSSTQSAFNELLPMKNPLHIKEARCSGRESKANPVICPNRNDCGRHRQIDMDRKLGIDTLPTIKVYSLPYVKGQECHFFTPA